MTEAEGDIPGALTGLLLQLAEVPRERLPAEYLEPLRPGTALGRFLVERELGRGGFGTVYAALDTALGRRVALKVLHPGAGSGPDHPERLRQEAEAVARLQHPALVTLFDVGQSEHGAYLVFELLAGETLAARLRRGPLQRAEVLRIGLAVAEALAHAHAAGVLHLDLKPANVFLCADGAVKVLDFGMARLFGQPSSASGGTPGYMAPEQAEPRGGDQRSDLFSLGVLLHELGGGRVPRGQASGIDLSGGGGARPLRALVVELTRADPTARPAGMEPVVARLRSMRGARRRVALGAGAVLALAVLLGAGALLWRRDGPPRPVERLQLVLASGGNGSGRPELDHLPALVRIGLEDSRRVGLVAAGKVGLAAREGGQTVTEPPDPDVARELAAAAGGQGLLIVGATAGADGLHLSIRAEVPIGTVKFERELATRSTQAVPQALDGLLRELRVALGEPAPSVGATAPIAELATPSLEAFAAYAAGQECERREVVLTTEGQLQRCGRAYRDALGHDPSFALAHLRLAELLGSSGVASQEAADHLAAATARLDRLTHRDAALVQAWSEHAAGRHGEALLGYTRLLGTSPDDVSILRLAARLTFDRREYAQAAPFLSRILVLEPRAAWARDLLVTSLALSGDTSELRALADRLAASLDWPARRAAIHAYAWLGDDRRSVELARAAIADEPGVQERRFMLLGALETAGRFEEAEAVVEALYAESPGHVLAKLERMCIARSLGKLRKAWSILERTTGSAEPFAPVESAYLKALLAAGDGDIERLRSETTKVVASSPDLSATPVVLLALITLGSGAAEFQDHLQVGSTASAEVAALVAWRAGRLAEAVAALAALERTDPWPNATVAPSYLLAEVALASDPAESLAAAERFRGQWPQGAWRAWAYPRSLLISATAALRLGDREAARSHLDRLDALLRGADDGLPLARDARELRRRFRP